MNIRPVSDLRNKYPEIEQSVLREDEAVYLTKNGYGSMVLISMERYEKLTREERYNEYVERILDESEESAKNPNRKTYTHEEIKEKIRRLLNGEEVPDNI